MVGTNVMVLMHAAKPHFGITFSSTPKRGLVIKSGSNNTLTSFSGSTIKSLKKVLQQ